MCFSVIVGKQASAAGHVLLAANDDWMGCPGHVHHVPRRIWRTEDTFLTVRGVSIPQPVLTFGYTHSAAAYQTGTRAVSWADGVNDRRVAISMQGVYAFADFQRKRDVLEADDLAILMLERGSTARQAIELAGELIAQYGYTVSSIKGAEGTVCMAVADPEEGFFLELGSGGYWCARRVADDRVECRPNCFGIGEVDFADRKKFLYSPGLYELAVEKGLICDGGKLNFAATFGGDATDVNPGYGGALNPVNTLRKWRVLNKLGGLNLPLETPIYDCVPQEPVTLRSLMNLMRDSLQDTQYSLAVAAGAGCFHNPFWMEISTSIAQQGTVICMIADLSGTLPEKLGCPIWFAYNNARLAPFIPCYSGGWGLPETWQQRECGEFIPSAAWWIFHEIARLCYRNYEAIAGEIFQVYEALEDQFFTALEEGERDAMERFKKDPKEAVELLSRLTGTMTMTAMETALTLAQRIREKY